jgi:hypothetical protein
MRAVAPAPSITNSPSLVIRCLFELSVERDRRPVDPKAFERAFSGVGQRA